jgi:hypothetical protein
MTVWLDQGEEQADKDPLWEIGTKIFPTRLDRRVANNVCEQENLYVIILLSMKNDEDPLASTMDIKSNKQFVSYSRKSVRASIIVVNIDK